MINHDTSGERRDSGVTFDILEPSYPCRLVPQDASGCSSQVTSRTAAAAAVRCIPITLASKSKFWLSAVHLKQRRPYSPAGFFDRAVLVMRHLSGDFETLFSHSIYASADRLE